MPRPGNSNEAISLTATAARQAVSEAEASILEAVRRGDVAAAKREVEGLLARHPGEPGAWALDADLAILARAPARALESIGRALALGGQSTRNFLRKARALQALRAWAEIPSTLDAAADAARGDAAQESELGGFCFTCGELGRAFAAYDRAVALAPGHAQHWHNRAAVRRFRGELALAESDYDHCLTLDPTDAQAQLNRSELRPQTRERNHVAELEFLLSRGPRNWRAEVALRYALAKEHSDLDDYAAAWNELSAGAALRRRHLEYDVAVDVATVDSLIEAFPARAVGGTENESAEPIFIVGMPRTGSTMLERILGRHPEVTAAGELTDFPDALIAALPPHTGGDRRARIAESVHLDCAALGVDYLSRTRRVTGQRTRFTDKMPLNYLYCGLIDRALPNARIVHLSRHPMATGFSLYRVLFDRGYPFSYDLREIAEYYAAYRRLMAHWQVVLPGKLIEVAYEDLVKAPEATCRRLFGRLGLEWRHECLDFHLNPDPTTTASAAQVRRPVYSSALDEWQHFADKLAPLRERLEALGVAIPPTGAS
jgi:tetratricopeptide (TPR) repeat protein